MGRGGGSVRSLQLKYVSILKTPGIYLDLHSNDHRDQLFIQLPQHNQLLQRQAAQPADRRTDRQTDEVTLGGIRPGVRSLPKGGRFTFKVEKSLFFFLNKECFKGHL